MRSDGAESNGRTAPLFLDRYYSIAEVALCLGVSRSWVDRRLTLRVDVAGRPGETELFWPHAVDLGGGDIRIPAGDLNRRLEEGALARRPAVKGVWARGKGELRRKVQAEGGVAI